MIQRRQELSLTLEPGQPLRVAGKLLRQDLDGHVTAKVPIERPMDLAHAALAEFFMNFIMAGDNSPGGNNVGGRLQSFRERRSDGLSRTQ